VFVVEVCWGIFVCVFCLCFVLVLVFMFVLVVVVVRHSPVKWWDAAWLHQQRNHFVAHHHQLEGDGGVGILPRITIVPETGGMPAGESVLGGGGGAGGEDSGGVDVSFREEGSKNNPGCGLW